MAATRRGTSKTRVFLGGYLNFINAQNLNCLSIARHLDKTRFSVYALLHPLGDFEYRAIDGVRVFRCWRPMRWCRYVAYLWGVWRCDVAYLPKRELAGFHRFLLKVLNKRSFTTVEGLIDTVARSDDADRAAAIRDSYAFTDRTYAITRHLAARNQASAGIRSDGVLYLGVERAVFEAPERESAPLTDVVFIGNHMRNKGITDVLRLALELPELHVHIVGSGLGVYDLPAEIARRGLKNVTAHGALNPRELAALLKRVQLHYFPSRSEGFPKVTLESAAAGVPSIVYADYGASEWIATGENGFVVSGYDEARAVVSSLIDEPATLSRVSSNAARLGLRFDWATLIADWEAVILDLRGLHPANESHRSMPA